MELTPKQKAFADYYIECGNQTESARRAGYSERTAAVIGNENLKKPNVLEYIAERQKQIDDSRIADVKEVMQFYSAVLRGEVKDQFDMDAALSDRIAAGKELMKRFERSDEGKKDALDKLDNLLDKSGGVI